MDEAGGTVTEDEVREARRIADEDRWIAEYAVCQRRGHDGSGHVLTSIPPKQICRWCGTHFWTEHVAHEGNAPSRLATTDTVRMTPERLAEVLAQDRFATMLRMAQTQGVIVGGRLIQVRDVGGFHAKALKRIASSAHNCSECGAAILKGDVGLDLGDRWVCIGVDGNGCPGLDVDPRGTDAFSPLRGAVGSDG